MTVYELCLVLRIMPKNELKTALKRIAESVLDKGGILRKLENLGTRQLPHKMSNHGFTNRQGSYYLLEFNLPRANVENLLDECSRDVDVIRKTFYYRLPVEQKECTIEEEIQPPPYRKSVQELVAQARKLDKPKFNYGIGLDYYPFQK